MSDKTLLKNFLKHLSCFCVYGGQKTTWGSQLPPFTMWVSEWNSERQAGQQAFYSLSPLSAHKHYLCCHLCQRDYSHPENRERKGVMATGSVLTLHICHSCHSSARVPSSQERRLGLLVQDGGTKRKRSQGSNAHSGEHWLRHASQPCLRPSPPGQ